jgi:hypothetical protein
MKPARRVSRFLPLLLCSILLLACKTSDDATAAAKQLATTSTDLANYYSALSQIVTATIAVGNLQSSLLPHAEVLPFSEEDRALLTTTSAELQKRAELAKALQGLSSEFSSLTGSTAPTDVSNAASKLANELTTLGALPKAQGSPMPLPSAIGDVAKLLVSAFQQHEEKKAAPAIEKTVNLLADIFSSEKDAYDSLNETYLTRAESVANYCIDQNLVDDTSVLSPALQPFSLTGRISSTADIEQLKKAAKFQVKTTHDALTVAHNNASDAMLKAIKEMGTRFDQLANEGSMKSRGTPVTLTTVENWINTVSTYLSSTSTSTNSTSANANSKTPASSKNSKK